MPWVRARIDKETFDLIMERSRIYSAENIRAFWDLLFRARANVLTVVGTTGSMWDPDAAIVFSLEPLSRL